MSGLFIDGQWQDGQGEFFSSINPASGHQVWRGQAASIAQVFAANAAAKQSFYDWSGWQLDQRVQAIEAYKKMLERRRSEFADAISAETGKPKWEADTEVGAMINKVAISVRAQVERAGSKKEIGFGLDHRPHGVMAVFGPYNFPGHLPNGHIIPALLAGNTIIYKPSELTPNVAELMIRLWHESGLPKGVINLVQGGRAVGEALVGSLVDGILFTGSSATGHAIHRALAGRPDIMLALEMGGNNPLIVDQVSAIQSAARTIVLSAFLSAGQRCTCARRLILTRSEQNREILKHVLELSASLRIGKPHDKPEPFMGPVISPAVVITMLEKQQQLLKQGAKILLEGRKLDMGNAFVSPAILDVNSCQTLTDEEIFAPLLQVIWVDGFDQAIRVANDTRYGLAAGLLSDNADHINQFLRMIRAGVVSVNKPTAGASSALPFGGIGSSGNHRPSAYYAADYSAWPQAQTLGDSMLETALPEIRGLQA